MDYNYLSVLGDGFYKYTATLWDTLWYFTITCTSVLTVIWVIINKLQHMPATRPVSAVLDIQQEKKKRTIWMTAGYVASGGCVVT